MAASRKPSLSALKKRKQLDSATFKNSLRLWQARWKAERSVPAAAAKPGPAGSEPGSGNG
jgi:hypothetical protein